MIEGAGHAIDLAAVAAELSDEPFVLLESGGPVTAGARYSVLAFEPSSEIVATGDGRFLERLAAAHRARRREPATEIPFAGGLIGYLGYELLHEIEPVVEAPAGTPLGSAPGHLLACETVICVDRVEDRTWISASGNAARARELVASAPSPPRVAPAPLPAVQLTHAGLAAAGVRPDTTRERYLELVDTAREHIRAGDVFELCVTRRFDADDRGLDLHRALRAASPAPMSAWLSLGDTEVACASPERLVRLYADGTAETRPIKGTRPRGTTAKLDEELRADLESAAKDRAEHVMIVDVARNDLGRVCEPGSVEVTALAGIEAHPAVWQMVSTVRGELESSYDAVDLLRAVFPAASMTGAPKVQAMRLISRLERSQRGVYSGAIGYIDDGGAMDMGVVIRTLVRQDGQVSFHSGGAITSDSDPAAEEQETLDKVAGLVAALQY